MQRFSNDFGNVVVVVVVVFAYVVDAYGVVVAAIFVDIILFMKS